MIIVTFFVASFAYYIGTLVGEDRTRKEAVKRELGEWYLDEWRMSAFRWKGEDAP